MIKTHFLSVMVQLLGFKSQVSVQAREFSRKKKNFNFTHTLKTIDCVILRLYLSVRLVLNSMTLDEAGPSKTSYF